MPTYAPKNEPAPRELVPEGTHLARCYSFIELGTVTSMYTNHMVRITFELPDELREFKEGEGKKPMVISGEYTYSMFSRSKLRKLIEGMYGAMQDGEADMFDFETLPGKECLLTVTHNPSKSNPEKIYANIGSAARLMKGQTVPNQINPSVFWTYENFTQESFNELPEFLRNKMVNTPEYRAAMGIDQVEEAQKEAPFDDTDIDGHRSPESIASEIDEFPV